MKKISLVLISFFVALSFAGSALAVTNSDTLIGWALAANEKKGGDKAYYYSMMGIETPIVLPIYNNDKPESVNLILKTLGYNSNYSRIELYWQKDNEVVGTGSWNTLKGELILFYTVKSSTGFELYKIDGTIGSSTGSWAIDKIKKDGISHVSGWISSTTSTPVPVPAAVWLLAPALFGVVALSRRRKSYGRTNH
ncbi:MAG: VPLPA-CTERM sorting domain-containing protein [Desulfamplus sp.]